MKKLNFQSEVHRILSEGGRAGHMMHLYENLNLRFSDLRKIFATASAGELEYTEKTDGQNNLISFDVKRKETLAVRNTTHEKAGGITKERLKYYFTTERTEKGKNPAPDSVVEAFIESMRSFEAVVKKFPTDVQKSLFLDELHNPIFYNVEVMAVKNPNIINYDINTLLIHRSGHQRISEETGRFDDLDDSEISKYLNILNTELKKFNQKSTEKKFKVQVNSIERLKKIEDDKIEQEALEGLYNEMNSVGLGWGDRIGDYMIARIDHIIMEQGYNFPEQVQIEILDIFLSIASADDNKSEFLVGDINRLSEIIKQGREAQQRFDFAQEREVGFQLTQVGAFRDRSLVAGILKKAIRPIEMIIHRFAVEALRGLESLWVVNNSAEADRIAVEVGEAVRSLERASVDYDAIAPVLKAQLEKLRKIDGKYDISTPAEGVVFSYGGHTYKFTGDFAPINQLLGLFTFGRTGVPALKGKYKPEGDEQMRLLEDYAHIVDVHKKENRGKFLVLLPGGYKPPTKGHYEMIKFYNNQPDVEKVLVLIGPMMRKEGSLVVNREEAMRVYDLYGIKNFGKVSVEETEYESPMRAAYEFLISDPRRKGYKDLIFSVGASDKLDKKGVPDFKRAEEFVEYFKNNPDKLPEKFNVGEPPCCPAVGGKDAPLSATDLRIAIEGGHLDLVNELIPDHIKPEELISIVKSSKKRKDESLFEQLFNMVDDTLNETAAVANGSVSGYAGKVFDLEEEDMQKEEKELRKNIRKIIKISKKKQKRKSVKEQKLRNLIRRMLILEAEKIEQPHRLTCINDLDKWFLANKKSLEGYYKSLSTHVKQRVSFRKHLVNQIIRKFELERSLENITRFIKKKVSEKSDFLKSSKFMIFEQEEPEEKELEVKIGDDGSLEAKENPEEMAKEAAGDFPEQDWIPGQDATGRTKAWECYNQIIKNLITTRDGCSDEDVHDLDPKDPNSPKMTEKEIFTYYFFVNLILYFNTFEDKYFGAPMDDVEKVETAAAATEKAAAPEIPEESPAGAPEEAPGESPAMAPSEAAEEEEIPGEEKLPPLPKV